MIPNSPFISIIAIVWICTTIAACVLNVPEIFFVAAMTTIAIGFGAGIYYDK